MELSADSMATLWPTLLDRITTTGEVLSPRGMKISELRGVTLRLRDPLNNTFINDVRKLSYRFQVAEWLYIWFGHDDVETILRYNPRMREFSDNGVDFAGAYGPPVIHHVPRVLELLRSDPDTRQAIIPIYRTPAGPSRDVPCTLAQQFLLRQGKLTSIVTMRSSDIWLGLPYDVFNFTMITNVLAAALNVKLGEFIIHLGSSHLYHVNLVPALSAMMMRTHELSSPALTSVPPPELDQVLCGHPLGISSDPRELLLTLPPVWRRYAYGLAVNTNTEMLNQLHLAVRDLR